MSVNRRLALDSPLVKEPTTTIDTAQRTPLPAGRLILPAGILVIIALLVAYAILSGDGRFVATGDSFPGMPTSIGEIVGYFVAALAAALVLGGLAYVVTTAQPDERGVLDPQSFKVHLLAERVSALWLVAAIAMVPVQAAAESGLAVTRLLGSGGFGDAVGASEMARGWIAVAICALVTVVGLRLTVRWVWHVVLLIPVLIGVIAAPVTGNAGQGPDHDYSTSAVIIFALALAILVGAKAAAIAAPPIAALRRRVRIIEVTCGTVALGYGALLLVLLCGFTRITNTDYGRLGILAAAALAAGLIADATGRSGRAASALTAMVSLAAVSAMAIQTAPRLLAHRFTAWDVFLGYELPQPPNALRLLTLWRFDPLIGTGAVVLGALYVAGVLRLRRRGDQWPAGRSAAWLAGCVALLFVSSSGVKAYGSAMFSVHMSEHMTLNMFIPVFLVLGAPLTLALRALPPAPAGSPPGPREWLLWLIHSPLTRFISHPVTAFALFVGSLYAVYFTPIFDTLVRYHWGHEFMSIHFLLTGYLYFWGIIGIDPGPRRLPFVGRLGLLFAVMPFHAFFGIATMTMTTAIGGTFYRSVALPWLPSVIDNQHLGGAIAWASSEMPILVVVVALVAQWARQDRRAASRSDRHADSDYADDDLDAYNAMLKELSRNRR